MLAVLAAAVVGTEIAQDDRRSGLDFAGPETRAMQQDDTANPGMLWVQQGESLWAAKVTCQMAGPVIIGVNGVCSRRCGPIGARAER